MIPTAKAKTAAGARRNDDGSTTRKKGPIGLFVL